MAENATTTPATDYAPNARDRVNTDRPGVRVGLFGIGLETYWAQFAGLRERLLGYQQRIAQWLEGEAVVLVDGGLIDTPVGARACAERFAAERVDVIFLFISTYALSSTVLPVVQRAKVPVVVLNVQPVARIDYAAFNAIGDRGRMTGEWLAHCQACSVPEIASVFNRAGIAYHLVSGYLDEERTVREIRDWVHAAAVAAAMCSNRLGILGHYYGGMLDVYTDLTQQSIVFGTHIELLEMCEVHELRAAVDETAIAAKILQFQSAFAISPHCEPAEIRRAARTSCALDALVANHDLGSLAYYYEGRPGNAYEDIVTSVIAGNSLLTARHVPVAGENEVKNAQAMKILDLFGAGGSFSEFYAIDFVDDVVLLGHDGPAHFAIAEGAVGLVPLPVYHGKPGKGLSIQMTVKHGPVTLLSVCHTVDGVMLLVAEGESVAGPVLEIGNTNSRYRFAMGARAFIEQWSTAGPSHHLAVGLGHIAGKIAKFGALIGVPVRCITGV